VTGDFFAKNTGNLVEWKSVGYLVQSIYERDRDTLNSVGRLIMASPSPWMTNHPKKGVVRVT